MPDNTRLLELLDLFVNGKPKKSDYREARAYLKKINSPPPKPKGRACKKKQQYQTQDQANEAAFNIAIKGIISLPYKCNVCNHWHLTRGRGN